MKIYLLFWAKMAAQILNFLILFYMLYYIVNNTSHRQRLAFPGRGRQQPLGKAGSHRLEPQLAEAGGHWLEPRLAEADSHFLEPQMAEAGRHRLEPHLAEADIHWLEPQLAETGCH